MKASAATPTHLFSDRARLYAVPIIVSASFLLVGWATAGLLFGGRGLAGGDDWYIQAEMSLGQFPACIGITNFNMPWRPFAPTLYCLLYQVAGPNLNVIFLLNAFAYAALAFAWYGIVRNVFGVSPWFAFVIGLIVLVYPDDLVRLAMIGSVHVIGPAVTLYGIWAILTFWDRPLQRWRLVLGCLLGFCGFLAYETFFFVWAVGLPLALFYKNRGFSRRWLWTSFITESLLVEYLVWRYVIVPRTYTEKTVIFGNLPVRLELTAILKQVIDSFINIGQVWVRNLQALASYDPQNSDVNSAAIFTISIGVGLLILLALYLVYRLDSGENATRLSNKPWALLIAMPILVILLAFPFYLLALDLIGDSFHTIGTPFAVSVGLIGLLTLILRTRKLLVPITTIIVTALVTFSAAFSGYANVESQRNAKLTCDLFLRLTDVVERLPQNVYVIITAPRGQVLPESFGDLYRLTSYHAALFYEGPYTPDQYSYGYFGHLGYLIVTDSWAELMADGVKVFWPPWVTDTLHVHEPLPKLAPLDHTLFIKYDPYHELTILSAPQALDGLVLRPSGGANSRASNLARHYCDWDPTLRDMIQQQDQLRQYSPTAALLCHDEGLTVYKISSNSQTEAFSLSKEALDRFPEKPASNTLITQEQGIRLYRLTSGELQINAPPSRHEQAEYVFRVTSCSR
jgi:hypothetical protein